MGPPNEAGSIDSEGRFNDAACTVVQPPYVDALAYRTTRGETHDLCAVASVSIV